MRAVVKDFSDLLRVNVPCAAEPRAFTMRSGMRSWSKWVIFSRRMKSSSRVGPRGVSRSEFWLSATGMPWLVVSAGWPPGALVQFVTLAACVGGRGGFGAGLAGGHQATPGWRGGFDPQHWRDAC